MDYIKKHPFEDLTDSQLDEVMAYDFAMTEANMENMYDRFQRGRKEIPQRTVSKRLVVILVADVAALGVTTAYASEISTFIQSLLGKTGVYSTVIDGAAYYLESPIALDGNRSLSQAIFTADSLEISVTPGWSSLPDVKIRINGEEFEPNGFGGDMVAFSDLAPTDKFDFILDGKSYPVVLANANAITNGNDVIEVESASIPWMSMGYKKIDSGVQILTTFDNSDLKLQSLLIPESDRMSETFSKTSVQSNREDFVPLMGYDANGNAYEYQYDTNDMGRPLTKFTSNVPKDEPITLMLPGIVVRYEKEFTGLNVALPAVGEKQEMNEEIDFSLQKMELQSVERSSATTARLIFKLNTGEDKNVKIWNASMNGNNLVSGELLWENGVCTADVTFAETETQIDLQVAWPSFIVNGNWELLVE